MGSVSGLDPWKKGMASTSSYFAGQSASAGADGLKTHRTKESHDWKLRWHAQRYEMREVGGERTGYH